MSKLHVGLAAVDITPPPGLPLMGNFRDDYLARGVHDPLMAKAIVFEDPQGAKAAVLAVDVCMLDRAQRRLDPRRDRPLGRRAAGERAGPRHAHAQRPGAA